MDALKVTPLIVLLLPQLFQGFQPKVIVLEGWMTATVSENMTATVNLTLRIGNTGNRTLAYRFSSHVERYPVIYPGDTPAQPRVNAYSKNYGALNLSQLGHGRIIIEGSLKPGEQDLITVVAVVPLRVGIYGPKVWRTNYNAYFNLEYTPEEALARPYMVEPGAAIIHEKYVYPSSLKIPGEERLDVRLEGPFKIYTSESRFSMGYGTSLSFYRQRIPLKSLAVWLLLWAAIVTLALHYRRSAAAIQTQE